jgi:hypothetical protein
MPLYMLIVFSVLISYVFWFLRQLVNLNEQLVSVRLTSQRISILDGTIHGTGFRARGTVITLSQSHEESSSTETI